MRSLKLLSDIEKKKLVIIISKLMLIYLLQTYAFYSFIVKLPVDPLSLKFHILQSKWNWFHLKDNNYLHEGWLKIGFIFSRNSCHWASIQFRSFKLADIQEKRFWRCRGKFSFNLINVCNVLIVSVLTYIIYIAIIINNIHKAALK